MITNLKMSQILMEDYATKTGTTNLQTPSRRYLWTDAFAVTNFLGLYQETERIEYLNYALQIIDQVHKVLGKHRLDEENLGWLSGLSEKEGQLHPTLGGLRIGKHLSERKIGAPIDEFIESDCDGQYFHYLTKWMYALNRVSIFTGKPLYNNWAMELAKVAHSAFTYEPKPNNYYQGKKMYWKMSINLTRPLVKSMGLHDPLDGLITYLQLEATAHQLTRKRTYDTNPKISLKYEIQEMKSICKGRRWVTQDPLGIGGLLIDSWRLIDLTSEVILQKDQNVTPLLEDIDKSLELYSRNNQLSEPAGYRLAFRELGLAIGLQCIGKMKDVIRRIPEKFHQAQDLVTILDKISEHTGLYQEINSFWLSSNHRAHNIWQEHEDINNVMLASSLTPIGFL